MDSQSPVPNTTDDGVALRRAVKYSRTREALYLTALVIGWAIQIALLWSGWASRLARVTTSIANRRPWLGDGLFVVVYSLLTALCSLPLDVVRGYVVEHRFGLSTQTRRSWAFEHAKAVGLGLLFELPAALATLAIIRRSPRHWWLILSCLTLPVTVVLAQLYPILIAPIFNRFTPLNDPALDQRIRQLTNQAGVHIAQVAVVDMSRQTRKVNAFFAGIGPTRRIALGDTLVDQFSADEIEVIIAHELGHQVHHDIWKGVAMGSASLLLGAFALAAIAPRFVRRWSHRLGYDRIDTIATMPLLSFLASIITVAGLPIGNAFSRQLIERPADRYALALTSHVDAFISAMEKLTRVNLSDPDPPTVIRLLLYSHPTAKQRIAAARAFQTSAADQAHVAAIRG